MENANFGLIPFDWLKNKGIAPHVVREIEKLVFENQTFLKEKYNEYHGF